MAPRRKNQESDLPQPFVEEEQVAAGDAGYVGSSNNLVREEVPPQSAPVADLGGAVASLLQMMEGRLDGLGQNHQQVTLQLRSLDERYESYNSRVDRLAQTRNRSLDDVNPITHNFNANMSIPSAVGNSSQPRQENFSSPVNNQPSPHRANHGDIPATAHVEGLNDVGMGELPPRGGNPSPTFNIPVDQPPMHGAGQPPPIPMARPYMAPASVGGGGNLGGDHIPPRAYPRPIPPQFNGQGMDPMGFMPPPGGHDMNVLRDQVAQLLTEQLGMGVRPTIPPVYRKPYPEWVDRHHPFPRGFRVPEFATFTGMGDQSTVEHVGRFTVQCGDVGDFVKLRLFGNSLTGPAFAWYVNLPSNSIQNWQQMEQIFHAQFYRSEPEVSMADLARMRQQPGESVEKFLTAFKNARNRCYVNLTEREFVKLAQGGLNFELRKKFQDREFSDLFQLMSCAVRYESLLHEEESRRSASRGSYLPNFDYAVHHIDGGIGEVEVDLAEIVPGKPYVCATLAKIEGESQGGRPNRAPAQPRKYTFDVSKSDMIFDQLHKDGQVKLSRGHSLPSPDKLKGRRYCKWHNSMSHSTDSCIVFRNVLQDAIEKGRIKFPEPRKDAMMVDTDPFPAKVGINMVNPDFSKVKLPRFKLVIDNSPPHDGSSSSAMQMEEEKLCIQCKKSLNFNEEIPSKTTERLGPVPGKQTHQRVGPVPGRPVQQRLGPFPSKPRYPPYQRQVEGVRQPMGYQPRQWLAHGPPMKRTFRIPDVPRGGWHTYDVRRQQPIALADLTRTQKRRFLRKNAQTRRDQCEVAPGEAAESQQSTQGDGMQTNIKVDNTVSTGLKVTVLGRGKHVQTNEVPKEEEKMEDNFQGDMDGYDADIDDDDFVDDEMIVEEHPNPRFGREDKEDEGDDHGLAQTVQFGSLPPVVVNNYILPIVFQWSADGEQVIIDTEAVEGEATVEEEAIEDQPIAQLIEELTLEEQDDDEPWSVRMVRKGCRLDLEAEAKRQYRSSQRILKELYEAGHKQVGLLGEDGGRYPYYVLYQGPEESIDLPVKNPSWGPGFDEPESSSAKEDCSQEEKAIMAVMASKGKAHMNDAPSEDPGHLVVFKEPEPSMSRHLRPLYIKAWLDEVPVSRVLVDNGAAVNVMPTRMLKKLGKTVNDLIPTEVFITSFNGGATTAKGILPVVVRIGSQEKMSAFFVVDGVVSYNALLGRDWIHASKCVPSSLHQCLMLWNKEGMVEVVQADNKPFAVGANVAEAPLYDGDFGPLEVRAWSI
ncbi:hypothetical protein LINGRAHAP2_LOCUS7138 [Linum grandiflorum]